MALSCFSTLNYSNPRKQNLLLITLICLVLPVHSGSKRSIIHGNNQKTKTAKCLMKLIFFKQDMVKIK